MSWKESKLVRSILENPKNRSKIISIMRNNKYNQTFTINNKNYKIVKVYKSTIEKQYENSKFIKCIKKLFSFIRRTRGCL